MEKVTCGIIEGGGYLGRQLAAFIEMPQTPIEVIAFSKEKREFATTAINGRIEKIDVLLNLGSKNEVVARQGGRLAEDALILLGECFLMAVRSDSANLHNAISGNSGFKA